MDAILSDLHESVGFFSDLSCRWEDEHEYEDPSEYSDVFMKNYPKLVVDRVLSDSKYLGFDLHHVDDLNRHFQLRTTQGSIALTESMDA